MKQLVIKTTNNLKLIILLYIASIVISAGLFSIIEGKTFFEGVWFSTVTALTIGYGDLSPITLPGRIIVIVLAHFWIFVIAPMVIANIVVNVLKDRDKFTNHEQEWLFKAIEKIAERDGVKLEEQPPDC
jgi:voltage-gated potassium channel Kch